MNKGLYDLFRFISLDWFYDLFTSYEMELGFYDLFSFEDQIRLVTII